MDRPHLRTEPIDVTDSGHLTELLYDDGRTDEVLVCAAHGGRVEPGTAEVALELATELRAAACWATLGFDAEREPFEVYHPASTAIDPGEYPLLAEVADRGFRTVVSLHGLADAGVLVGGGIERAVKHGVRDRLDAALPVGVQAVDGGKYGGVHPENFVNWLAAGDRGGLQLELGPGVRDDHHDAVVAVIADLVEAGRL